MRAAAVVLVLAACTPGPQGGPSPAASGTPAPKQTPDIGRVKLSLIYTAFLNQDVHKVTSRKALEGALDAVRKEVKALGGDDQVATPAFQDVSKPVSADFAAFAEAASTLSARTPRLSPERLVRAAVGGMITQSPDCHTFYQDPQTVIRSSPKPATDDPNPPKPNGAVLQEPDQAGLEGRLLDGGIVWIRWTRFVITGTYQLAPHMVELMDKGLARGAKAWLFDLRGNTGGVFDDQLNSLFLNGETALLQHEREGQPVGRSTIKQYRLADRYQLPIAVVLNDRGGSGPEIFSAFLRETGRATIVGHKTIGCMGAASPLNLPDGSYFSVVVSEFVGAKTGYKYNNNGVPPDIEANDAQAIGTATKVLLQKIGG